MGHTGMRLAVFGRSDDPLSDHTEQRARALGHEVTRVPLGKIADGAATALDLTDATGTTSSWLWLGEELGDVDACVVRQYPAVHALLAPPDTKATAAEWFQRGQLHLERASFAQSLLIDLERRGVPMVNPPMASAPFDHKALQLAELKRMGAPIPRTLVTNFPDAARIFVDDLRAHKREAIVKPSAGGAEAQLVDEIVRARLPFITSSPVIIQERVVGPDVRVTVVGDRVVSSVAIDSDTLDYRTGPAYRTGGAVYRDHPLPADVSALCVNIARAFSHVLSGIDLKLTRAANGRASYVVIEANSGPVYLDIELKTGAPITDAIVQWLARAKMQRA